MGQSSTSRGAAVALVLAITGTAAGQVPAVAPPQTSTLDAAAVPAPAAVPSTPSAPAPASAAVPSAPLAPAPSPPAPPPATALSAPPTSTLCAPSSLSRFWDRLDVLCGFAPVLPDLLSVPDGPERLALAEVRQYCATRRVPTFAAAAEEERMAALLTVARLAGLSEPSLGPAVVAREPRALTPLVALALRGWDPAPQLEVGGAGRALITEFVDWGCHRSEVATWGPTTCASAPEPFGIGELRSRLATDLLLLPLRAAVRPAPGRPAEESARLRGTAAVVLALAGSGELVEVVHALLANDSELGTLPSAPCVTVPAAAPATLPAPAARRRVVVDPPHLLAQLPPPAAPPDPGAAPAAPAAATAPPDGGAASPSAPGTVAAPPPTPAAPSAASAPPPAPPEVVAGRLLERILLDGPRFDRDPEHYARLVSQVLAESGWLPTGALSELRRTAVTALVAELGHHEQVRQRMAAEDPGALARSFPELAASTAAVVGHALTLATDRPHAIPVAAITELVQALLAHDLGRVVALAAGLLPPGQLTERQRRALELGARLVGARSEREAKAILADLLRPPWLGGFVLDANVGTPVATADVFRLELAGTVGYEAQRWGALVDAQYRAYDTQLGGRDLTEMRAFFAGEGWYNTASLVDARLGLGLGAEFGVDEYFSDAAYYSGAVDEELSLLVRGAAAVRVFGNPSPRAFFRLQVAAGGHREYFNQDSIDDAVLTRRESDTLAGNYRARAVVTWRVLPGILRTTLLGRASILGLTRSDALIAFDEDLGYSAQNLITTTQHVEALGRLNLDLELLEMGRLIRPGVYAQVEYVATASAAGSVSATIPSVGLGLRSHVPK